MRALAERLGVSRQLVGKLFSRGYSVAQIEARIQLRRVKEEPRSGAAATINGHTNGHDPLDLPTVPVPVMPPFAESEARKEYFLSEIRELQAAKLRGQALPVEPLRSVVFYASHFLTNRLRDLPDELMDQLGPENTKLLRIRIHTIFDEARRVLAWEHQRAGLPVSPEPPQPVRKRLAYYERFIDDSRTGEIETIPTNERIDSPEWQAQHPSVSFEEGFRILAAKRRWDEDMLLLLRRRAEWDLPNELPEPVPPEVA